MSFSSLISAITRTLTQSDFRGRIVIVLLICCFFVLVAVYRLFSIQILSGSQWAAWNQGLDPKIKQILPPRGNIYIQDTAGQRNHLVATNKPAFVLGANPKEIESAPSILNNVSSIVNIEAEEYNAILGRLTNREKNFVEIADRVTEQQKRRIEKKNLQGVKFQASSFRYYPSSSLAAHVVGFLGYIDAEGKWAGGAGVEKFFAEQLSGKRGIAQPLPERGISEEQVFAPGADVILTIDQTVQFKVEQELSEVAERLRAEFGTAIFMDPKTGRVLAMANVPLFDANKHGEAKDHKNHAVQSRFEMGSVFKPLTMAFGIDSGKITPQTTYDDPGVRVIDGFRITNFDGKSYGTQTMTEVLESSLNTGTIFALEQMTPNTFLEYVQRFELGEKTGVQLPGEINNNIQNLTGDYVASQYATASFGHGVQFTPLRILASFSALANEGVVMKPYVIDSIIDQNGEVVATEQEEIATPISARTAQQVTDMLVSVAENGYDRKVKIPGYNIAAKTGTAQIERNGVYTSDVRHAFIGYAPASDPKFIGILMLENPKDIRFASDSLAPVFRNIADFLLQYYEIPPDK